VVSSSYLKNDMNSHGVVTLVCDDGQSMQTQKMILSTGSSYFKTLLEHSANDKFLLVRNIPYKYLTAILEFMSVGEVSIVQDQLPQFLKTAKMLQVIGLAETEERVNVLQAERDELSNELAKLTVAAVDTEDKETTWSNQLHNIQYEMVLINKEKTCLKVENRTLQSHASNLLTQINTFQSDYSKLKGELSRSTQSEKKMKQELNLLLDDQTRLQRLQEQLQSDNDKLSTERDDLKLSERTLRMDNRKLKDSAMTVSHRQDDIIKAKEAINMGRENLKMDKKTLSNLGSEHSRLKDKFRYDWHPAIMRNP
jgi:esterase/lipase